ncbi:uncharacterized protein LOC110440231 [Mizuhopecten yessoensis]|uniref:uncharacterized protein LOC110440231 n=1 Tax=Mizuhopecten yessoensis TaxID=6573 RepID=UPI000B4582D0|nr:uncharacterized protein LOC110440231 [Mizuhopecten yessoensis]
MGKPTKRRPVRFNCAPGRHSKIATRRYAKANENIRRRLESMSQPRAGKPYKLKHSVKIVNGQVSAKLVVKRLPRFSSPGKTLHSVVHPQKPTLYIHSSDRLAPDGYRLFNLGLLQKAFSDVVQHTITCTAAGEISVTGKSPISNMWEKPKCGMASVFELSCVCGKLFQLENSPSISLQSGDSCHDVNLRAVWGAMVTGGGASNLSELFGTMNAPGISQPKFSQIEHIIGSMWNKCLQEDMIAAGVEERRLAIERGDLHDGVPAITVICDGGWSKRTHKHTYNALGGVGVIFGAATGKLLHVGVKNKHCYICTIAESRNEEPAQHECFRNWSSSSQSMEVDVILDGFLKAESTHGVRYMRLIADGDSSVFATIQECVPIWGREVSKLECANHICKCLRSSLEKLVVDKPAYKGKGRLTKFMRVRLTTAVRCAIRLRSKDEDKIQAARQLEHDVRNSVHHVFGDHSHCSDFCKSRSPPTNTSTVHVSSKSAPTSTTTCGTSSSEEGITEDIDTVCDLIDDQRNLWLDGTSEKDMDDSRYGVSDQFSLEADMLRDISVLLDRIASKSRRLLGNFTTNLAESWMAIRCKFDGGKIYNRCNRGSWHSRCYGGALRKNFGPAWSPLVWHRSTGVSPGSSFTSLYRRRSLQLLHSIKSKGKLDVQARKRKRKLASCAANNTKKAKRSYGAGAIDVVPDIEPDDLKLKCDRFLKTQVERDNPHCTMIEEVTRAQSHSVTWQEERKKRLTSSIFGEIIHRNPKRPVAPLVSRLIYPSFRGTRFTMFGLNAEFPTIKEYIQKKEENQEVVKVEKIGLVIDMDNKYLGASSDGRVVPSTGPSGLLEIKNLLQKNTLTFMEAATTMKAFCLEVVNGSLQLKRKHNYFYQCQGQLNVIKMPWLDFVVRRTNPNQIYIERIERDEHLWHTVMLPKLRAFYMKAMLPELAHPREHTSTGIREPHLPWFDSPTTNSSKRGKSSQQKKQSASTTPQEHVQEGTSAPTSPKPGPSGVSTRTRRSCAKFVGRRILHEWCVDEAAGTTQWYKGRVLDVLKGKDGQPTATYEVLYDGEEEPVQVQNLQQDLQSSSLKFIDI